MMNLILSLFFLILILFFIKLFIHKIIENPDKSLISLILIYLPSRDISFRHFLPIKTKNSKLVQLANFLIKTVYILILIVIPIFIYTFYSTNHYGIRH